MFCTVEARLISTSGATMRESNLDTDMATWEAGEHKQLNHFHALNMYGPPTPCAKNMIVLCLHWQYHIKCDGTLASSKML